MTGEFPRAIPRPVWLTARARNAVRRPVFIGAVSLGTFIAALVAFVLAPPQIKHAIPTSPTSMPAKPDTAPMIAALGQARGRLAAAESSLTFARIHAAAIAKPTTDSLSPRVVAQRDSLSTAVSDLDALLTRVETAPLPASYRALAESPQLASTPRIKLLLDSLNEVEQSREAFGTNNTAVPAVVALTARSADIGREIQDAAQVRRDALRDQVAKLNTPTEAEVVATTPSVDTAGWVAERDSARSLVSEATSALEETRRQVEGVRQRRRSRERAGEIQRAAGRASRRGAGVRHRAWLRLRVLRRDEPSAGGG